MSLLADDTAEFTPDKIFSYAVSNLRRFICDLELLLNKWKIKINTNKSTAVIMTKKEASAQKLVKSIRTRNSMVGRSKIFGHTPRKKLLTWEAHIKVIENNTMQRFVAIHSVFKC
jgi:hypothetical protein